MIAVIDYGAGNLRSVENTLQEIGCAYTLVRDAEGLRSANKIILPGVGHFGQMMGALQGKDVLREKILAGVPFLGICLGMQALFEASEEAPDVGGLGIFPGMVKRFPAGTRCPHMGWNQLTVRPGAALFATPDPYVYFAHSYYVPEVAEAAAVCTYTVTYTAALEKDNIHGVQFHPEKSSGVGQGIVRRFVELR